MTDDRDIARVRALASTATTAAIERAVGRLLGADEAASEAAVRRLAESDVLEQGLAAHALVLAARRGTAADEAVGLIATGERLPGSWSDYELRAAGEEGLEEAQGWARRLPAGAGVATVGGAEAPSRAVAALAAGADQLAADAAASHLLDGLPLARAVVEHAWIRVLVAAVGRRLVARTDGPDVEALRAALERSPEPSGPAVVLEGDGVVERGPAYIPVPGR